MNYMNVNPANPANPEGVFTRFPDLSPEMRLRIWEFVDCVQPPVVEVAIMEKLSDALFEYDSAALCGCCYPYNEDIADDKTNCMPVDWTTARGRQLKLLSPVRKILHVNHESRVEALKKYQRCFGKDRQVYINPSTDTLFIHVSNNLYNDDRVGYHVAKLLHSRGYNPGVMEGASIASVANPSQLSENFNETVLIIKKLEGNEENSDNEGSDDEGSDNQGSAHEGSAHEGSAHEGSDDDGSADQVFDDDDPDDEVSDDIPKAEPDPSEDGENDDDADIEDQDSEVIHHLVNAQIKRLDDGDWKDETEYTAFAPLVQWEKYWNRILIK